MSTEILEKEFNDLINSLRNNVMKRRDDGFISNEGYSRLTDLIDEIQNGDYGWRDSGCSWENSGCYSS